MMDNIYRPLYEVTLNPKKYPELHIFLQHVVGFDSVDDESKNEKVPFGPNCATADKWNRNSNPPYAYYIFYMYANIVSLNRLRKMRGMNLFTLRPHCGEAGNVPVFFNVKMVIYKIVQFFEKILMHNIWSQLF